MNPTTAFQGYIMKLPIHPLAPCRIGDKRYTLTLLEVPTRGDIALGLAAADPATWPQKKYSAYGHGKADAARRVEGWGQS